MGFEPDIPSLRYLRRLLVRHSPVMKRLREEVQAVIGDAEPPTREQIRKMPYLAMVIKESMKPSVCPHVQDCLYWSGLRVYPPVPLNNRTANKATILPRGGGSDGTAPILVRKGEVVVFSQYVNARRKNIFGPDADEFRPERWEEHETSSPYGWAYFPFNGGPRACLGQDFALMEVSYTVVRLLQAFQIIRLPDGEKNERVGSERQRLTLVLSSADGCRVELEERSKGK